MRLHGFGCPTRRRDEIWRRAWLTVVPSVQEGWGLTVLEANQWGVPCVAFDVPGLRDAVIDGTDRVAGRRRRRPWRRPSGTALDILSDRSTADAMAERCRAWSARFSWHDSARRLAAVVDAEIARVAGGRGSRRTPGDQATVARFTVTDDAAADEAESWLHSRLRRTDDVSRQARSFTVLLKGSDEVEAAAALADLSERAELAAPPRLAVALQTDLLSLSSEELAG